MRNTYVQHYMHIATGAVDTRDGWDYQDEFGKTVNGVDLGDVEPVELNTVGDWVDADSQDLPEWYPEGIHPDVILDWIVSQYHPGGRGMTESERYYSRIVMLNDEVRELLAKNERLRAALQEAVDWIEDDRYAEESIKEEWYHMAKYALQEATE